MMTTPNVRELHCYSSPVNMSNIHYEHTQSIYLAYISPINQKHSVSYYALALAP